jgi:hypothetical protein
MSVERASGWGALFWVFCCQKIYFNSAESIKKKHFPLG